MQSRARTAGAWSLAALSTTVTALTAIVAPSTAFAHGAPEFPISRQYNCFKNPSLPACQAAIAYGGEQAIYDWNGVNQANANGNHKAVAPDLKICAGGQEKFKGFDLARADWPATAYSPGADGKYEYRYNATAPHRSLNWTFFLTRDGWNPATSPLRWSDLEQVQQLGPEQIVTSGKTIYTMKLTLPKRTGRHVLFSAWQRSDSTEAFYACSDVDFGGGTTPPGTPSDLKQIGQVSAAQDLPSGSTVKLRVFNGAGNDLETTSITLTAAATKSAWLGQIATKVNQSSAYLKIGTLQGGVVVVPGGATVMDVYLQNANSGASYAMDVLLPTTPPTTPPGTTWTEGASYTVGQVVSYQGRSYRCLQAHTAYVGAGWTPASSPTLWQAL
ncbi:lytic polysaccharide monooxygenase [Mitsuaria sp. BK037]|uniref:lytic polysaccharide monooxygenase n=1 Tax=Mitsuaria sp. BK037 TaxID=2587122 RepID=UPI00161E546B|nr:lytic polysaccharide monooxygenase [Mitsuaria sp. BK037]MBB3280952.1 chitin-binding protein [Mitsuaria sp. BK037]